MSHEEWDGVTERRQDPPSPDRHDGWRFEKSVSLGNVLTAIIITASVIGVRIADERRFVTLELGQQNLERADMRHEAAEAELKRDINSELTKLATKIDVLQATLQQYILRGSHLSP